MFGQGSGVIDLSDLKGASVYDCPTPSSVEVGGRQ